MTVCRCALFSRREDVTPAQFASHWLGVHGQLAAKLPGLGTYRQNHIRERLYEAPDSPVQAIDGIAQLSFSSIAAMEVSDASPEYAACKLDIPRFQGEITILVTEADELQPGHVAPAKLMWVSTRRADVPCAGLRERWLASHRGAARELPGARRFVQNFVVDRAHPVAAGVPSGDPSGAQAVSELWFDDAASARAALQSPAGRQLIFEDPMLASLGVYLMQEVTIV
ncbi:MAG: EthD family reductase [Rhodocyclaceae bacterium]|nr:EthD family reductase [Rhodocyclaceae bacterium]MDQ7998343.1 EthD family reductase [Pseudomonadota bacterium]